MLNNVTRPTERMPYHAFHSTLHVILSVQSDQIFFTALQQHDMT